MGFEATTSCIRGKRVLPLDHEGLKNLFFTFYYIRVKNRFVKVIKPLKIIILIARFADVCFRFFDDLKTDSMKCTTVSINTLVYEYESTLREQNPSLHSIQNLMNEKIIIS